MKNEHTKGPWKSQGGFVWSEANGPMKTQSIAATADYQNCEANAARIVACVNACDGWDDPAQQIEALHARVERLHAQNVALAEALAALLAAHDQHSIKTAIQHYSKAHEKEAHVSARTSAKEALSRAAQS